MWDFIGPSRTLSVASASGAAVVLAAPVFFTGVLFGAVLRVFVAVGFFTIFFLSKGQPHQHGWYAAV
ncbi:MAG: hypothetical protein QGD94_11225 [Planctomycetia bacterium]|nr:hypothetical protein [Planctomycetia bacterium]